MSAEINEPRYGPRSYSCTIADTSDVSILDSAVAVTFIRACESLAAVSRCLAEVSASYAAR